jgi:hypothetical protein
MLRGLRFRHKQSTSVLKLLYHNFNIFTGLWLISHKSVLQVARVLDHSLPVILDIMISKYWQLIHVGPYLQVPPLLELCQFYRPTHRRDYHLL